MEARYMKNSQEVSTKMCIHRVGLGGGAKREPLFLWVYLGGTTITSSQDVVFFIFLNKEVL